MIVPPRDGREVTAADHLATDAVTRAVECAQSLVNAARARLDMRIAAAVAEALTPLDAAIKRLEEKIDADDT